MIGAIIRTIIEIREQNKREEEQKEQNS